MDEDYTLAEVATLMRRGVERVRAMAARGDLDTAGAYQLAPRGRWRFRRRDFDGWHAGLRRQSDPYAIEPPSRRSLAKRKRTA